MKADSEKVARRRNKILLTRWMGSGQHRTLILILAVVVGLVGTATLSARWLEASQPRPMLAQDDAEGAAESEEPAAQAGDEAAAAAEEEPAEPGAVARFVNDVDAAFGAYVVTPLDAVIFYDLANLWDVAMGPPQLQPVDEYWPEDRRERLQAEVDRALQRFRDQYGRGPESDQEFREAVFDIAGGVNEAGEPNPTPRLKNDEGNLLKFPTPDGYSYEFDPETQSLMIKGRPKIPFIVVWLLAGGIFFTLRMRFINFRAFWHAIRLTKGDFDDPDNPGEVSHFQALSSALSATVGLGNIAGVAIAIGIGGPGATFWMILIGLFGMSMKFNECTLGQMYRKIDNDGVVFGGPMRYLYAGLKEMNLGPLGVVLSLLFSLLCIGASFGGGNAFQVRQSLDAIKNEAALSFLGDPAWSWVYGVTMAVLVGLVIVGGIRSIGSVASKIVPVMCGAYVVAALYILVTNAAEIPGAFAMIFGQAFEAKAMYGGFLGVMMMGIKRAVFSNEAGAGSAAIAHSAAKTEEPVSEGIVALLEPFIDTVVVCTMTALVVIITGVYSDPEYADVAVSEGAALTSIAFQEGGFEWFKWILYAAVVLFAYSTMISWSYYGERCWSGLFGARSSIIYKGLFLLFVVLGSVVNPRNVLNFSDMLILGMAFPNLLGGVILSGKVKRALDNYWGRYKAGEFEVHKK